MFRIGLTANRLTQAFRNPFVHGEIPMVFMVPESQAEAARFDARPPTRGSSFGKLRRALSAGAVSPSAPKFLRRRAKSVEVSKADTRVQLEELFQRRVADSVSSTNRAFKSSVQPGDILAALQADGLQFSGTKPPTDLELRQASRAAAIQEFSKVTKASVRRAIASSPSQVAAGALGQPLVADYRGYSVNNQWHPAVSSEADPQSAALREISRCTSKLNSPAVKRATIDPSLVQLSGQLRHYVGRLGPKRPAALASGVSHFQHKLGLQANTPADRMVNWVVDELGAQDGVGPALSPARTDAVVAEVFGELEGRLLAGFFANRARVG